MTPRGGESAQLLGKGETNWCVAPILKISMKAFETDRSNIMQKVGCESITELVR